MKTVRVTLDDGNVIILEMYSAALEQARVIWM